MTANCPLTAVCNCRGFSLVELVAVLIILGIIATFVVPRFTSVNQFREYGYTEELITALRYAQQVAVARNRSVIVVTQPNSFRICLSENNSYACPASGGKYLHNPGSDQRWNGVQAGRAPAGVNLSTTTFAFNGLGEPGNWNNHVWQTLSVPVHVTVGNRTITIEAYTGYVY